MFHNFRMYVGRSPLEVSWTPLRGEDNHDVQGLGHRVGIRVSAKFPGPSVRRQQLWVMMAFEVNR
jgi:hypothetical protein